MAKIRLEKSTNDYFICHKGYAQNKDLSMGARGVMLYAASKPDDWRLTVNDLVENSPAGVTKIYRILKELIDLHYMSKSQVSYGGGKFGPVIYRTYEVPELNPNFKKVEIK